MGHGGGHGHGNAVQRGMVVVPQVRFFATLQILGMSRAGGAKIAAPLTHELGFRSPVSGPASIWTAATSFAIIWTFVRDYLDTP